MEERNAGGKIAVIHREWKSGDRVELKLPMHVFQTSWYENSRAVERGPLVYALKIEEERKLIDNTKDPVEYGDRYEELRPASPWNFALIDVTPDKLDKSFRVITSAQPAKYPWNPDHAPIQIKAKAKKIPSWVLYNEMTGPIPYSITYQLETAKEVEEVTLIPYGCTNLRISQFPVVRP